MSPSRAARRPSTTPTPARRARGAATRPCRRSSPEQIDEQLALAVDRVMAEGSLYDRELAALAIKQARGDLIEAIFLVRAYRTTLPRFGYSRAARHRRDADRAPHLGDVQGPARRTGARPDLRLHAPPARLRAGGRTPSRRAAPPSRRAQPERRAACHRPARRRGPDRAQSGRRRGRRRRRPDARAAGLSRPTATCACRTWRAATRASCWRSAIRPSAATAARIPSSARSASARSRWSSSPRSSASPSRSGASRSDRVRDGQPVPGLRRERRRSSRAATASSSASPSARRCPWRWSTGRCGRANSARTSTRRHRTRSSCCRTPTTSRRPASSST